MPKICESCRVFLNDDEVWYDSGGVPLCAACWEVLRKEELAQADKEQNQCET